MSDLNEIKGLVEGINKVLVPLREEVESLKSRDVIEEEKFAKMADKVTADMEKLQQEQRKIQAALNRPQADAGKPEYLAEHKAKFDAFMRSDDKDAKRTIEVRAMNTNVQPDGGYLVRPELSSFVIDRIFETSPLRSVANVETGSTKSREYLIDDDEAESGWVAEGTTQNATDTPELGQKEITSHTQRAQPSATWELLGDAYVDVEAWLAGKVADKFARTENTAFVTGNGVGKPRGFLDYPAWGAAGTYQRDALERRNIAVALNAAAIIQLQGDLKEAYQGRAVWGMKRTTYARVLTLAGADQFFFGPVLLRDGQAQMTLLGKPVVFMDDMPIVSDGNSCMVYGDFSAGYTIYDRAGLQIIRDPFVLASQGRVRFVTYKRVGGDVTNFEALKIGVSAAIA